MASGIFSKQVEPDPTPELDRRRSLTGVPVINDRVAVSRREDGNLTVTVHYKRGRGWLARLQPPTFERTYKLDKLGSFVYGQIDGRREVKAIIDRFVREFKVNRREGELCVMQFLQMLIHRQVISIAVY